MATPVLSFCVPTYNQPDRFNKLLLNLKAQIYPEVEVIVRDDSTNDETAAIVAKHPELNIRYFRGQKAGLDEAINFLTSRAEGEYVWWFGDDMLAPGALKRVLEVVKEHSDVSFVYVNSKEFGQGPSFEVGEDRFLKDGSEALELFGDMLGFITATVLRRKEAQLTLLEVKGWLGSSFFNLAVVLGVLSKPGRKYYIAEPYIISDPRPADKPSWYDGFTVFAVNLYHIVDSFKGNFRRTATRKMLAHNFHKIWRSIIVFRAKGWTHGPGSLTPKLPILARLYWSYPEFYLALPFLLLPRSLDRFLYAVFRRTFHS